MRKLIFTLAMLLICFSMPLISAEKIIWSDWYEEEYQWSHDNKQAEGYGFTNPEVAVDENTGTGHVHSEMGIL